MSLISIISTISRGSGGVFTPPDPGDTTPPTLISLTALNATTIRAVFSEATTPTVAGWSFNNGSSITPSAVTFLSGFTWDFTVAGLAYGQTITGSYNSATGNTLDASGNELVTISNRAVTNSIIAPEVPEAVDYLFIFAGQSNLGRTQVSEMTGPQSSAYAGATTGAKIFNPYVSTTDFVNLNVGSNTMLTNPTDTDEFGPEASMVKLFNTAGKNLWAIKYGIGNTNLAVQWNSRVSPTNYNNLLAYIETAFGKFKVAKPTGVFGGVIWMQGENDATNLSWANNYQTNLQNFFDDLRAYIDDKLTIYNFSAESDNWKSYIGRINGASDSSQIYRTTVRAAQAAFCAITGNKAVLLDTDSYPLRDTVHYNVAGQIQFGTDIYNAYVNAQPLSFTAIPFADPDLRRPGAGLEFWIHSSAVKVPEASSPTDNELDRYDRFEWRSFENGTAGTYTWTEFDNSINTAIDRGQKFSFAIMTLCDSCTDFTTTVGGGLLTSYPLYLHNLMQAEAVNDRDWIDTFNSGCWIPNWNSVNYLDRHQALLNALAAHIAASSYSGVNYADIIRYVDVRGIGNYNEWHHYPYKDDIPIGRFPEVATYKRVIDDYIAAFPDFQLVALCDGFDSFGWSDTPEEVIHYLLTVENNVGKLGYRRDNVGSGWSGISYWVGDKLENNPAEYNPGSGNVILKDLIIDRWMEAPVVGEVMGCCSTDGGASMYWDLVRQVEYYHHNSLGNGNLESPSSSTTINAVRLAAKTMGYRLKLNAGSGPASITRGTAFLLSLTWENEGVSPTYENWDVDFELRSGATVVWSGTSTFNPRLFLPGTDTIVDTLTVGMGVAAGTYNLHLIVRDAGGYRDAMPLFITGVQGDGSYILKSNIVVS